MLIQKVSGAIKLCLVTRLLLYVVVLTTLGCTKSRNEELFAAIRQKDSDSVSKILRSNQFDLDPPGGPYEVRKPLAFAAAYGNLEIVKMIVEAGADLDGQVAYGDVALIKGCEHGNYDIVEWLIRAGANVNTPNAFGVTPFIGLCGLGEYKLVQLALEGNADWVGSFVNSTLEEKGVKNYNPLQMAVRHGHAEIVELLLSYGANPNVIDCNGNSLGQIAEDTGETRIHDLLQKWHEHQKVPTTNSAGAP